MPKKILIGSILKPVDDTRHYHKMAKSLASADHEIHIYGYYSSFKPEFDNIVFHPSKPFKRLSIARLFSPLRFLLLALRVKPHTIICGTHELLNVSTFLKLILGSKFIYDVRENYYYNITKTTTFPSIIKYPLGLLVRFNEWIQAYFVDYFLLAEKCYSYELPFLKKEQYVILENKYQPNEIQHRSIPINTQNLMITGTITSHYGIEEGVLFFDHIRKFRNNTTLFITGICRDNNITNTLQKEGITTEIDTQPVPYSSILKTIKKGGIALLPYPPNTSTQDKLPTKFYEYLYYGIPMIVQKNTIWEAFLRPYKAAIFIDFASFDIEKVVEEIENYPFYTGKPVGDEILWDSEKEKLLALDILNS